MEFQQKLIKTIFISEKLSILLLLSSEEKKRRIFINSNRINFIFEVLMATTTIYLFLMSIL